MKNEFLRYLEKKIFLMITATPLLLAGCNTMEGLGTDIEQAGHSLEKAAVKNKDCPCPYCSSNHRSYKH